MSWKSNTLVWNSKTAVSILNKGIIPYNAKIHTTYFFAHLKWLLKKYPTLAIDFITASDGVTFKLMASFKKCNKPSNFFSKEMPTTELETVYLIEDLHDFIYYNKPARL